MFAQPNLGNQRKRPRFSRTGHRTKARLCGGLSEPGQRAGQDRPARRSGRRNQACCCASAQNPCYRPPGVHLELPAGPGLRATWGGGARRSAFPIFDSPEAGLYASTFGAGKLLLAERQEDGALQQFEAILTVDPNEPSALGERGTDTRGRRADYLRSIRYLERAYEVDRGNTTLALALAEARIRAGETSEADGLISELQSAGRLTEETRRVLALVWLNCGHPEKGAALAGDDLSFAGEFREAAVKEARQDFLHSNYRTAAGNLEVAKKMGASGAEVHRLLGNCYYELDEPKQASDEFQAALRLDPDNEQTYFNLGMLYLKYRTPGVGHAGVRDGLKQLPNSGLLWVGLGLSQHLAERTDQAELSLKKALELDPSLTDAYVVLGDILEARTNCRMH